VLRADGYADCAPWQPRDGYRHAVKDSVCLASGYQGRGLGADLLSAFGRGAGRSRPSLWRVAWGWML